MAQNQPRQPGELSTNKPAPVEPQAAPVAAGESPAKPVAKPAKEQ
jgi:hypothetical protein